MLDAAVAGATIDVPDALVEARSRELWDQMLHSLSHQGITKEMYLQISGRSEEDIVAEGKPDAERQLKREAVLAAVVAAESIEPSEDEVLAALEQAAPSERTSTKKLLERMKSAGRLDALEGRARAGARRSTCWPSPRSRSRSSRRRRATSSGPPARTPKGALRSSGHRGPDPSLRAPADC